MESLMFGDKRKKKTKAQLFDELINSDVGQRLFSANKHIDSELKLKQAATKSEEECLTTHVCIYNSLFRPGGLASNAKKRIEAVNQTRIDSAHQKIFDVNNKLQLLESKYQEELGKLEQNLSPKARKSLHNSIGATQKQYKMLKNQRLLIVKQQRVMKNEYPEGFKGLEVYYLTKEQKSDKSNLRMSEQIESRLQNLSNKSFADTVLTYKPSSAKENNRGGLKRLVDVMPHQYHNSSLMFTAEAYTPQLQRARILSAQSHGHRDYNIITGAYLS